MWYTKGISPWSNPFFPSSVTWATVFTLQSLCFMHMTWLWPLVIHMRYAVVSYVGCNRQWIIGLAAISCVWISVSLIRWHLLWKILLQSRITLNSWVLCFTPNWTGILTSIRWVARLRKQFLFLEALNQWSRRYSYNGLPCFYWLISKLCYLKLGTCICGCAPAERRESDSGNSKSWWL